MKKLVLAASAVAALTAVGGAFAAEKVATSTASWTATAYKDTTSALVVTPLRSLEFRYAEGLGRFNTQNGAFDVAIQGQSGATDFKLVAEQITDTLTRNDVANENLVVGVSWLGNKLVSPTAVADGATMEPTVLVDTSAGTTGGLALLAESAAYAGTDRTTQQASFEFSIDGYDGSLNNTDFSTLTDGFWDGVVSVEFTATWTTPDTP